jgi:hypothetical protein
MIRNSDAVPTLRIVLDHLPSLDPADADRSAYKWIKRDPSQPTP